jgi:hypothetical protein
MSFDPGTWNVNHETRLLSKLKLMEQKYTDNWVCGLW